MLKPQDCMILMKMLAHPSRGWDDSQRQLSEQLLISLSEVNAGIKRLIESRLLQEVGMLAVLSINVAAAEEFLISGLKYVFPAKLGEFTRGVPTGVGAPLFRDKILLGNEPIPVWPDAKGEQRGVALPPIYPSVTKALRDHPDMNFYELLVLVDVIRTGGARERNLAIQLLKERLKHGRY